jgi:hypothetical protein
MATAAAVFELFDAGLYLDPLATGVAPPWEMPDYAQELEACKRYWGSYGMVLGGYYGVAAGPYVSSTPFPVTMRIVPAISFTSIGYDNSSSLATYWLYENVLGISATATASARSSVQTIVICNARM